MTARLDGFKVHTRYSRRYLFCPREWAPGIVFRVEYQDRRCQRLKGIWLVKIRVSNSYVVNNAFRPEADRQKRCHQMCSKVLILCADTALKLTGDAH